MPGGESRGTQEGKKEAKFPEADLTFFLLHFVVCAILLESCLQRNSTIRLSDISIFGNGKIHVNKKLVTLEVILRTDSLLSLLPTW